MKRKSGKVNEKKRLIVLSLDAVGSRDLEFMKTLPNFMEFFERAAGCERVKSVYPSLTYPAHTSIVTGRYPKNHGIVNNLQIQPRREKPDWFWKRKYVTGTTLYDEAEKAGYRTCSILWPVTAGAKITYNLPEIWPNRSWQNQIMVSFFNGTPGYQLDINKRFSSLRKGTSQPYLDNFVHQAMLHTIRRYEPDVMLVHMTDVDTNRHDYGVDAPEIKEAFLRHDKRLGELTALLKEKGWYENTNLVVLGDHYQMDISQAVYPNYWLKKQGWLTVKDGKIAAWKVLARECDGSCYIYLKDMSYKDTVRKWLELWAKKENSGIERIYEQEEAERCGADPSCGFMLEAKKGYFFQNGFAVPYEPAGQGTGLHSATHGYSPFKEGYETFFMAAGPDFRAGARETKMCLVDEGATLAHILNLDLGKIDGKILKNLLTN